VHWWYRSMAYRGTHCYVTGNSSEDGETWQQLIEQLLHVNTSMCQIQSVLVVASKGLGALPRQIYLKCCQGHLKR
jgi:hypothetical protein